MIDRRALAFSLLAAPLVGGASQPSEAEAFIAKLTRRADRLLANQGLRKGSVAERIGQLHREPRWLYSDDDLGRERAVAEMNARVEALRPMLGVAFGGLAVPGTRISRMTRADEARGRAGYREAPAYFVDLKAIRSRPSWTLPSVAFHETVPGHFLQMAVPAEHNPAFSEGWATYAELLADDLGAYRGDPMGEIGFLHWMLFRMGRIVADVGIHQRGWSRDQAVVAVRGIQGPDIAFIGVEADVERIAKSPGQYAAQGLTALKILRERPRHRGAWPAYHRAVLAGQAQPERRYGSGVGSP